MRNKLKFLIKYNKGFPKYLFALTFIFSISSLFGQDEITVTKYASQNSTVCTQFDITLEIIGNPHPKPQEVILVIDVSGSMNDAPGSDNDPIDYAQSAAVMFVNNFFTPANNPTGLNRIALVTFSSNSNLVVPLTDDSGQNNMVNAINALTVGGRTNTEAGIIEADNELTNNGTFDCATSRSIILLSDGVSTGSTNGNCSSTSIETTCQTDAIQAGIEAQTTVKLGEIYTQSIFTIGLVGAISDTEEQRSLITLDGIQNAGAFWTEDNADLADIYNQILGQLFAAAATQLSGEPLVSDIIQTGFSLVQSSLNPSKGTTDSSGQLISWFIDRVLLETITLNYSIQVNDPTVCGNQISSNTVMNYENSMCEVDQALFNNPGICVPCPEINPEIAFDGCTNSINYSNTLSQSDCASIADEFLWEFYLNGNLVGTSTSENGTFNYSGTADFEGDFIAELVYTGTYGSGCILPDVEQLISLRIPSILDINITSQTDVDCAGGNNGEIIAEASDGTPPYSYSIDVGNNYQTSGTFSNLTKGNYTIKVLDDAGCTSIFNTTVADGALTPPTINTDASDSYVECDGTGNTAEFDAWLASNGGATTTDIGSSVNWTNDFTALNDDCGATGTTAVIFTATDNCGNASMSSASFTITDTMVPELITELQTELTVSCNDIPDARTPGFVDDCSADVTVIFDETDSFDGTDNDYEILRTWTVTDDCNNTAVFTQTLTVTVEEIVTQFSDSRCIIDGTINLNNYLSSDDDSGTWIIEPGNTTITDDSIFDPENIELGDYVFSYSIAEDGCISITEVTIEINDKCVVLPCGSEDVEISKAVTPNGDQWNEFFRIRGVEACNFVIEVKIFNRWGALIYESNNYQNDWNGTAHKSSIGNSDQVITGTYFYIVNLKNSGLAPLTGPIYLGTK